MYLEVNRTEIFYQDIENLVGTIKFLQHIHVIQEFDDIKVQLYAID